MPSQPETKGQFLSALKGLVRVPSLVSDYLALQVLLLCPQTLEHHFLFLPSSTCPHPTLYFLLFLPLWPSLTLRHQPPWHPLFHLNLPTPRKQRYFTRFCIEIQRGVYQNYQQAGKLVPPALSTRVWNRNHLGTHTHIPPPWRNMGHRWCQGPGSWVSLRSQILLQSTGSPQFLEALGTSDISC